MYLLPKVRDLFYSSGSQSVDRRPLMVHSHVPGGQRAKPNI